MIKICTKQENDKHKFQDSVYLCEIDKWAKIAKNIGRWNNSGKIPVFGEVERLEEFFITMFLCAKY